MAFTHLRAGEFMPAYFRRFRTSLRRARCSCRWRMRRSPRSTSATSPKIAALALTGSGHEGKTYPLTGPQALGMAEVAAKLWRRHRKADPLCRRSTEAARQAQLGVGMPPYLADALFELFAERRNGKEAKVPRWAVLLGGLVRRIRDAQCSGIPGRGAAAEGLGRETDEALHDQIPIRQRHQR